MNKFKVAALLLAACVSVPMPSDARTRASIPSTLVPVARQFTVAPASFRYRTVLTLYRVSVPDGIVLLASGKGANAFVCTVKDHECAFDIDLPLEATGVYDLLIFRTDATYLPPLGISWGATP